MTPTRAGLVFVWILLSYCVCVVNATDFNYVGDAENEMQSEHPSWKKSQDRVESARDRATRRLQGAHAFLSDENEANHRPLVDQYFGKGVDVKPIRDNIENMMKATVPISTIYGKIPNHPEYLATTSREGDRPISIHPAFHRTIGSEQRAATIIHEVGHSVNNARDWFVDHGNGKVEPISGRKKEALEREDSKNNLKFYDGRYPEGRAKIMKHSADPNVMIHNTESYAQLAVAINLKQLGHEIAGHGEHPESDSEWSKVSAEGGTEQNEKKKGKMASFFTKKKKDHTAEAGPSNSEGGEGSKTKKLLGIFNKGKAAEKSQEQSSRQFLGSPRHIPSRRLSTSSVGSARPALGLSSSRSPSRQSSLRSISSPSSVTSGASSVKVRGQRAIPGQLKALESKKSLLPKASVPVRATSSSHRIHSSSSTSSKSRSHLPAQNSKAVKSHPPSLSSKGTRPKSPSLQVHRSSLKVSKSPSPKAAQRAWQSRPSSPTKGHLAKLVRPQTKAHTAAQKMHVSSPRPKTPVRKPSISHSHIAPKSSVPKVHASKAPRPQPHAQVKPHSTARTAQKVRSVNPKAPRQPSISHSRIAPKLHVQKAPHPQQRLQVKASKAPLKVHGAIPKPQVHASTPKIHLPPKVAHSQPHSQVKPHPATAKVHATAPKAPSRQPSLSHPKLAAKPATPNAHPPKAARPQPHPQAKAHPAPLKAHAAPPKAPVHAAAPKPKAAAPRPQAQAKPPVHKAPPKAPAKAPAKPAPAGPKPKGKK